MMMFSSWLTSRPLVSSTSASRSPLGSQLGWPPSQIPASSNSSPAAMPAVSRGPLERREAMTLRVAAPLRAAAVATISLSGCSDLEEAPQGQTRAERGDDCAGHKQHGDQRRKRDRADLADQRPAREQRVEQRELG